MPPAAAKFAHLLTAGPQEMADAVASFEDHLFADNIDLSNPVLWLMVLDAHHPQRPFKPIMIPYSAEDRKALGGKQGRGHIGRFVASVAAGFHRLPPQVVRESNPFFADGDRLLYVAFAAETVHVADAPSYATDLLLDIPEPRQHHQRSLLACDGRGWLYTITRPDGQAGPPSLTVMACQADVSKPGRFLHKLTEQPSAGGLVPWGLDALASGIRRAFEGETPPCSDAKTRATQRKKGHHHRARRRRG